MFCMFVWLLQGELLYETMRLIQEKAVACWEEKATALDSLPSTSIWRTMQVPLALKLHLRHLAELTGLVLGSRRKNVQETENKGPYLKGI